MSDRFRLTGINSGMDTQSIVEQLVKAKSTKKEKLEKEQTKLGWKQEIWKGLNTKLFSLYDKFGDMKMQGAFLAKKASVVNSSIASVTADNSAVNGVQTLGVRKLAKTSYLTSANLGNVTDKNGNATSVTTDTKLGDLFGEDAFSEKVFARNEETGLDEDTGVRALSIKVYKDAGDTTGTNIMLTNDMTIEDFVSHLNTAGLNASYDNNNHRFFISSKTEGKAGQFSITAGGIAGDLLAQTSNPKSEYVNGSVQSEAGLVEPELGDTKAENAKVRQAKAYEMLKNLGLTAETAGEGYVAGQDAEIVLNGATFTSNSNTFNINGLNITATKESNEVNGVLETTNISVSTDVDGIYDTIKGFLKQYNEIINEMDKLYNADAAKGYEPLTSEEKDAMSETEIKDWEDKIKDSLLRRDDNLSSLISLFKNSMADGYTVSSGNRYSLASFGINTLSYFEAEENEKGAYHIDGDKDDEKTKGNDDKLRQMLSTNLNDTMEFFNQLSKTVYDKLQKAMTRVPDYRSFQKLYDDKMLDTQYKNYTTKIKEQEQVISDYEDKWYDKFAKMESAMEKVNSKSTALAGLFGTG